MKNFKAKVECHPSLGALPLFAAPIFQRATHGRHDTLIEKPMFMDRPTTAQIRVTYARICIEIKTRDELSKSWR